MMYRITIHYSVQCAKYVVKNTVMYSIPYIILYMGLYTILHPVVYILLFTDVEMAGGTGFFYK